MSTQGAQAVTTRLVMSTSHFLASRCEDFYSRCQVNSSQPWLGMVMQLAFPLLYLFSCRSVLSLARRKNKANWKPGRKRSLVSHKRQNKQWILKCHRLLEHFSLLMRGKCVFDEFAEKLAHRQWIHLFNSVFLLSVFGEEDFKRDSVISQSVRHTSFFCFSFPFYWDTTS